MDEGIEGEILKGEKEQSRRRGKWRITGEGKEERKEKGRKEGGGKG